MVCVCVWIVCELRRQAAQLEVPLAALSVKVLLERLTEIAGDEDECRTREILTSCQRVSGFLVELTTWR